jgi:hypothetical protein
VIRRWLALALAIAAVAACTRHIVLSPPPDADFLPDAALLDAQVNRDSGSGLPDAAVLD